MRRPRLARRFCLARPRLGWPALARRFGLALPRFARRPRASVRLRLTLTYTVLFVVTGVALLSVSYFLVNQREGGSAAAIQVICRTSLGGSSAASGSSSAGSASEKTSVMSAGPSGLLPVSSAQCPSVVGTGYARLGLLAAGYSSGIATGGAGSATPGMLRPLVVPPTTGAPPQRAGTATSGLPPKAANLPPATNLLGGGARVEVPVNVQVEATQLAAVVKASEKHTLDSFKIDSAIALGIVAVLSLGFSWWLAGRALRPVHRITAAARSLSERTLHDRINLKGPKDELKELADTFDAMLGRLERAFDSQRRFVANASHELRTPLATERVLIDEALADTAATPVELRSILEHLRENSEDTELLVDSLLALARSERGVDHRQEVELAGVVQTAIDASAPQAAGAGVEVAASLEEAWLAGDPGLLERLAGNLVENAIRYNHPGGHVHVATGLDTAPSGASGVVLEVSNSGPVVDPADVAVLVEPFRRGGRDRSRSDGGVGLGLSIVDAIVSAHGGRLSIGARPEGGLDVTARLPCRLPPAPDGYQRRRAATNHSPSRSGSPRNSSAKPAAVK